MTTNPNAPFGFKYIGQIDGSPSNFGTRTGMIASANTNAIFTGDPLKPNASGYLDVSTVVGGGTAIGGVAAWFEWTSLSQNKVVRQNWWPGNGDASGDVTVAYTTAWSLTAPSDISGAAITAARHWLLGNVGDSAIHDRTRQIITAEGTQILSVAGQYSPIGLPDVDVVLMEYWDRIRIPGIA